MGVTLDGSGQEISTVDDVRREMEDFLLELEKIYQRWVGNATISAPLVSALVAFKVPSDSALEDVRSQKVNFLLALLGRDYANAPDEHYGHSRIRNEIYTTAVLGLLEESDHVVHSYVGDARALNRLLGFLGKYEILQGMQGKVRTFLEEVVGHLCENHAREKVDISLLVQALLRYGMYDVIEQEFVKKEVYSAIPVLIDEVKKGTNLPGVDITIDHLLRFGYGAALGDLLTRVSDARPLQMLVKLSVSYLRKYGVPYQT